MSNSSTYGSPRPGKRGEGPERDGRWSRHGQGLMRWSPEGTNRQHLGVGLRGVRSRPGGTARGCAPWQRLLRDARAAPEARADDVHYPGRTWPAQARPPGHGGRPVGRQRRHRERAELAPPDVPDRRRRLVHDLVGPTFSITGRTTFAAVLTRVVSCRDPAETAARGSAATRRHGASARGGAGDHDRGRELVRADRAALRPRRHGDQLRGRSLPGPAWRPSRPRRSERPWRRRDLPAGHRQSRIFVAEGGSHVGLRLDGRPARPPPGDRGTGIRRSSWRAELHQGEAHRREGGGPLARSRDPAISEACSAARDGRRHGRLRRVAGTPRAAWDPLWGRFDLPLAASVRPSWPSGSTSSTCCRRCRPTIGLDCGVPARGLHGEAYRGHVFWDELSFSPCSTRCSARIIDARLAGFPGGRLRPGGRPGGRVAGVMFPGRAAATAGRRPRRCISTPARAAGRQLRLLGTSTSPSPTTRELLPGHRRQRVPALPGAPMIIEVARFSPAWRRTTTSSTGTRSRWSWAPTSITTVTPAPTCPGWTTTPHERGLGLGRRRVLGDLTAPTTGMELGINLATRRRSWTTGSTSAARCGSASTTTGSSAEVRGLRPPR